MKVVRWRASISFVAALMLGHFLSAPALAEPPSIEAPPAFQPVDANGVNLENGLFEVAAPTLSIGPADSGLSYQRVFANTAYLAEWRDNLEGKVVRHCAFSLEGQPGCHGTTYYSVSITGLGYVAFQQSGTTYIPLFGKHATLTKSGAIWTYTAPDGSVAEFSSDVGQGVWFAHITKLTKPNGEVRTYTWKVVQLTVTARIRRLQSVTNNFGYQLHLKYVSDDQNQYADWQAVEKVTAINNAVEYCSPTAYSCILTNSWPALTFGKATNEQNVTDSLGRVTRFFTGTVVCNPPYWSVEVQCGNNTRIVGVRRPTLSSGQNLTITYNDLTPPPTGGCAVLSAPVATISNGVGTWSYSFNNLGCVGYPVTATVTDPLSHVTESQSIADEEAGGGSDGSITLGGGVLYTENALGQRTTYTYDTGNGYRLLSVTYPEGNKVEFTYDTRGNLTERRAISKTPNTPADIVTSATYPSTCTNLKTCNKPTTYTDARGNATSFTYDSSHGGMLTMTSPAVGGVSPQTRYDYAQKYAWVKNSGGSIVQAATSVWRPIETSQCQTTASCDAAADEVLTTTTYQAGSSSAASNILPLSTTTGSGNGALAATITSTYTDLGDVATVDGPRTDVSDIVTYRYDAWRQKVGEILADPDGGGALLRPATRTIYNADGQVTGVDRGTVTGTSDSNWSAFSLLERRTASYNSRGLTEWDSVVIGGVTQSVTQYTYDNASRLDCTAVRMNPAIFASLPSSACSLGTQGSNGPDRISKNGYDSADRVLTIKNAYGTAIEQTTVTNAYTTNGKRDWVEDANGNRSDFTYDGFDRLTKLNFPSATVGAHSANSSDYEQYGYDAAGNMTSKRLRSSETIAYTYDVLNRETVKDIPGGTSSDVYSGYDLMGRKLFARFVSTNGDGVDYTYDALARVLSETSYGRALTFQYDIAGNRTRITYPDANYIQTTFDVLGGVKEIRENGATSGAGLLAVYAYDDLQRQASANFGNSTSVSFAYDVDSRDWSVSHNLASTEFDTTFSLSFSASPQILACDISNSAFVYSPPTRAESYSVNGLNQYTAVGGATFASDARGNLTADGARSFEYDLENHLVTVGGNVSIALAYDPLGRLRETVSGGATTQFLYDGDRLVAEYNGSNVLLRRYAHGPGVDEPLVWYEGSALTDRRTHHLDNQGSVIATSDGTGAGYSQTYGAYGEPSSWSGSRFKYTGQITIPDAALYYYKARMYDPRLGRFLQTDPIGYQDSLNLYSYVENDPENKADPSGLSCVENVDRTYACKFDTILDGTKELDRSQLTPKQKKKLEAFEKDYTETVNALARAKPGTSVEVSLPVGYDSNGKEIIAKFSVSAEELKGALVKREFVYNKSYNGYAVTGANSLKPGLVGRTTIGDEALGGTGYTKEQKREDRKITVIHEGFHNSKGENGLSAGGASRAPGHSPLYDKSANDMLGRIR